MVMALHTLREGRWTGADRRANVRAGLGVLPMSSLKACLGALLAAVALASCSQLKPDPKDDAAAQAVVAEIQAGDFAAVEARAAPEMKTPDAGVALQKVRDYLPKTKPRSVKTVGVSITQIAGGPTNTSLTQEYDFGGSVALIQTNLTRPAGSETRLVRGFNVQLATHKELAANDLTLIGKPALSYLLLALTIASPVLMLLALLKVLRTKGLKRKWLWGIVAFLGLFSFQTNWTTGMLSVNWLTFQIIGAGVTSGASLFSPWILTFTLPVGALLILAGVIARPRKAPAGS
jgi:hypothetical protein